MAALLARSIDTFSCAVRCSRLGYGTQAAMLNRLLFEAMVDAHWISTDEATAERRYADHDTHARMLLADVVPLFKKIWEDVEVSAFDPPERKRLDKQFGPYGTKPWSLLSIHDRVKLIEHQ